MRNSTVLTTSRRTTILTAALRILRRTTSALSPTDIAEIGLSRGMLRIPRGRNKGYLSQILQSTLYDNAHYSGRDRKVVKHKGWGQYKPR